jgi:hypothetical protein
MILDVSRGNIKVLLGDRTVSVPGEMFFPENEKMGFAIFAGQIEHWDYPDQDIKLTKQDIADVIDEIRADFDKGGHSLVIE